MFQKTSSDFLEKLKKKTGDLNAWEFKKNFRLSSYVIDSEVGEVI